MKISDWWNNNINDYTLSQFKSWVGDFNSHSKKVTRDYIIKNNYKSIIDMGCGLCDMYYGFKNDNYKIDYVGVDSCDYFLNLAKSKNINVIKGLIGEKLNIEDNKYDVVYSRHVLEHLPTYKQALGEFIRIAKKEVIIVFFIKPQENEKIVFNNDLYHNTYSKKDINNFIVNYDFRWEDINSQEELLFIKKK